MFQGEVNLTCSEKAPPESKGRKYIDESWSTGDLKDGKDWGIENSVLARSRGD